MIAASRWRAGSIRHIGEPALRGHHIHPVANRKAGQRVAGKRPTVNMLDPYTDSAVAGGRADRIGTAYLLAVDIGTKRQILSGEKAVGPG